MQQTSNLIVQKPLEVDLPEYSDDNVIDIGTHLLLIGVPDFMAVELTSMYDAKPLEASQLLYLQKNEMDSVQWYLKSIRQPFSYNTLSQQQSIYAQHAAQQNCANHLASNQQASNQQASYMQNYQASLAEQYALYQNTLSQGIVGSMMGAYNGL